MNNPNRSLSLAQPAPSRKSTAAWLLTGLLAAGALFGMAQQAKADTYWSMSVYQPGVAVTVGSGVPVYGYAPPVVYSQPVYGYGYVQPVAVPAPYGRAYGYWSPPGHRHHHHRHHGWQQPERGGHHSGGHEQGGQNHRGDGHWRR